MLSIVIPTFNRRETIVDSLKKLELLRSFAEIIVIDDGSEDGTFEELRKLASRDMKVFRNLRNAGTPHCWNFGLERASGDFVLFIPDDVEILEPDQSRFISVLLSRCKRGRIVGLKVVDRTERLNPIARHHSLRYVVPGLLFALAAQILPPTHDNGGPCNFVSGTMAVYREEGAELRFDEQNFLGTSFREEGDFQIRARKRGIEVYYEPALKLLHHEARSGGQHSAEREWPHKEYWAVRNHVRFVRKNFRLTWPLKLTFFLLYAIAVRRTPMGIIPGAVRDGCTGSVSVSNSGHVTVSV